MYRRRYRGLSIGISRMVSNRHRSYAGQPWGCPTALPIVVVLGALGYWASQPNNQGIATWLIVLLGGILVGMAVLAGADYWRRKRDHEAFLDAHWATAQPEFWITGTIQSMWPPPEPPLRSLEALIAPTATGLELTDYATWYSLPATVRVFQSTDVNATGTSNWEVTFDARGWPGPIGVTLVARMNFEQMMALSQSFNEHLSAVRAVATTERWVPAK